MAPATVTFRQCLVNALEYGSDDDHVGSRVFFDLHPRTPSVILSEAKNLSPAHRTRKTSGIPRNFRRAPMSGVRGRPGFNDLTPSC